jgi:cytidylate kinase
LGFRYLDTGAMYRAIAEKALQSHISTDNEEALAGIALTNPITFGFEGEDVLPSRVYISGQDVTELIRTPEIDVAVSPISAIPAVRTALVGQQRIMGGAYEFVVEGRDIGSVVFPDAEVTVFLTATAEERAKRRTAQNIERGISADFDMVLASILARDEYDSTRAVSPLLKADDACVIDSTDLTIDQVVQRIVDKAKQVV